MQRIDNYLTLLEWGAIASIAALVILAVVTFIFLTRLAMATARSNEADAHQAALEGQVAHLVRQLDYLVSLVARPR